MIALRSLGLAVLLLLGAGRAAATSGEWIDVTCPVCENVFEGWTFHSTNTFGGVDRDFCEHAAGGQVFLLTCWTCPKCTYTGMEDDFGRDKVTAALKTAILEANPLRPALTIDPAVKRTTRIPAWVRWDLYSQVLVLRGTADPHARAFAALQTAWTQRFDIGFPETIHRALNDLLTAYRPPRAPLGERGNPYDEDVALAKALERDAGSTELRLSATERRHRLLGAIVTYKERGEDPDAARALKALRETPGELPPPIQQLVQDVENRIGRERTYMERAVPLFEEAVKEGQRSVEDGYGPRYLLGELHRKLGSAEKAKHWLEPLVADAAVPPHVKKWAQEALARVPAPPDVR